MDNKDKVIAALGFTLGMLVRKHVLLRRDSKKLLEVSRVMYKVLDENLQRAVDREFEQIVDNYDRN